MINRYYAQWVDDKDNLMCAWYVFDRELTTPQGDTKFICEAINRRQAFLIRDKLNAPPRR